MRQLASIQMIEHIEPIEGKDRIVLASVLGWRVIVKKDEFAVGDKCVYCEIDSVLPEKEEFEFLRKDNFRIRTMKMAGVYSQGICFPLSILPKGNYNIGDDVTDIIGVKKWEPMEDERWWKELKAEPKKKKWYEKLFLMKFKWYRRLIRYNNRASRSSFPDFVSKTDETRIQAAPFYLNDRDRKYIATEKVDGTSGTFVLVRHKHKFRKDTFEYMVCSRNMRLKKDNSIYWAVSDKYMIEMALHNLIGNRDWVCIQGECIGPKIQKNKYGLTEPRLYVFNLIYPEGRMGSIEAKGLLETRGFNFVPIVNANFSLPETVDEMIAMADGMSQLAHTEREGLVIRSKDGKTSFKAVSNAFLTKWSE